MNIKIRLQQMLQILEDAERNGALSDIERDILLADLREAYAELKFGVESGKLRVENESLPTPPIAEVAETDDESDEDNEIEVELIFEDEGELPFKMPTEEVEEKSEEIEEKIEEKIEEVVENLSTLNSPLSTPKRSALLSLYEDEPTPILGEQFHEAPSVADTIACPKGIAESAPVASLREAIGVADRFMLIGELFDGDAEAYDKAISVLEAQPSLEDAMIYIAENYTWSPNATATKFVMELLNRKYN